VRDPAQMRWNRPDEAVPAVQAASPLATPAPAETTTPAAALPTATPGRPVTAGTGVTTTGVTTTSTGSSPTPVVAATAVAEALAGEPPAGYFRPEGSTGLIWENNLRAQRDLGWARQANPSTIGGAYQRFENGTMVWRQDTSQIYVFFNDGTWRSFADTFEEGDRESDAAFAPPAGKMQPIRGFGKVWRDNPDVREQLGWAMAKEAAQPAEVHTFERGVILRYGPLLFVAIGIDIDRGTWY
jgi:hypothetical protein